MINSLQQRQNMIFGQLRPNHISDKVILDAFLHTPRELFTPNHLLSVTYSDQPIDVGYNRYMLQPMILARLIQGLNLKQDSKVLVVGANTGYTLALLSYWLKNIFGLESQEYLYEKACHNLAKYPQVQLVFGALSKGWIDSAPFDAILIEGGISKIPENIIPQLALNGRIACIISKKDPFCMGRAQILHTQKLLPLEVFDANVPMIDELCTELEFQF